VLSVAGVTKRFAGLVAVDGFSHEFPETGVAGIIGPNGAGKSTLLHLISGFHGVDAGEIRLAGALVNRWSPSRRARAGLMRTFQFESGVAGLDVLENVLLGLYGQARHGFLPCLLRLPAARREERALRRRAGAILDDLGLGDLAHHDAQLLTYGQIKLLGIARSMVAAPRVLLLDEPAAGLNEQESDELVDTLTLIRDDFSCALVVIEHDMRLIMRLCERIQVLDHGRTICVGPPAQVRRDPTVLEAYLGRRAIDAPDR
jgi:branched-chain amino acid transport system ATP-binding protein